MRSEFITDVEQQYEVYCKIAEEYGFIDFNAKKSGFRCTTKSNEFNAGWIAFTGAIAAMREDQQSKVDELQRRNQMLNDSIKEQGQKLVYQNEVIETQAEKLLCLRDEKAEMQKRVDKAIRLLVEAELYQFEPNIGLAEQALKGGGDANQ